MFRCGDAFRIEAVYLCGITACPPNAEIHKTALGGEDSVAWRYFKNTEDAVQQLHHDGYFVYSIEQVEGATKLQNLNESINLSSDNNRQNDGLTTEQSRESISPTTYGHPHYAVILGNEVKGVKQTVVDMCDGCLEIPQFGTKHSLNVSTTAGIVMWEFCKVLALK